MTASLDGPTTALGEALRAFERALSDSRGQWDDSARHAFDRRYADRILFDGKQACNEMQRLQQELASAAKMLDSLG